MNRFLTLLALLAAPLSLIPCGITPASDAPLPNSGPAGDATPIDVEHTVSIVGIQIGQRMAAFIFISKDGKHLNVDAEECTHSEKCQHIMTQLGSNGQTDLIHFEPSHVDAVPAAVEHTPSQPIPDVSTQAASLPHRSLHEIDIQGHQAGTSTDMCPGQYRENVPESGLLLYCWGRKL